MTLHCDHFRTDFGGEYLAPHEDDPTVVGAQTLCARYYLSAGGSMVVDTFRATYRSDILVEGAYIRLGLPVGAILVPSQLEGLEFYNGYAGITEPHHDEDCSFRESHSLPMRRRSATSFSD